MNRSKWVRKGLGGRLLAAAALVALAVLTVACSGASDGITGAAERVGDVVRSVVNVGPGDARAPLTSADRASDRPVLAAKVDNAPAAVPQTGLDAADVVIEEPVEGGMTRFIALYQSQLPARVGPIRSAREVDALLLPPFRPVLATSGAAGPVQRDLVERELTVVEHGQAPGFTRDERRRAPSNVYAEPATVLDAVLDAPVLREPAWTFDAARPDGGEPTATVDLDFSVVQQVRWTWADAGWRRQQNGAPHATTDGGPLTADTVVVMRVDAAAGRRTDSAGNPTVDLDVVGSGPVTVLRDGTAYTGRWHKRNGRTQIAFSDNGGQPLALRPGRTWIELLPTDAELRLR